MEKRFIVDYKHSKTRKIPTFQRWCEKEEVGLKDDEDLFFNFTSPEWKLINYKPRQSYSICTFQDIPRKGSLDEMFPKKFPEHYIHVRVREID